MSNASGTRKAVVLSSFLLFLPVSASDGKQKNGSGGNSPPLTFSASPVATDPGQQFEIPAQYVNQFSGYRSRFIRLTGYEYSGLHWGEYISLYVNKNPDAYVQNYLQYIRTYVESDINEANQPGSDKFTAYAVGTIFLKENYRAVGKKPSNPLTITAMIKRENGYDSATHDWEFVQFNSEGRVLFDGNSRDAPTQAMCIKCHRNSDERDFVFSTFCSYDPCKK